MTSTNGESTDASGDGETADTYVKDFEAQKAPPKRNEPKKGAGNG